MIATDLTDDFERKRHYQILKLECLKLGQDLTIAIGAEPNSLREVAKDLYRSITEERWGSEPVEAPPSNE